MKRAPQTQSGGKWVNASREQTKHYLNPDNFLKSIENDPEALKVTGKVAVSALNVRSGVGTSYRVIDQIYNGKDVTIINEVNDWFEIKYVVSGENRIGWVSGNFVEKDSQEIVKHDFNEAYNPVARITATTLNVRQGPGTNNPVITRVSKGRRYKIVQGTGDWYQIDLGKGTTGWVCRRVCHGIQHSGKRPAPVRQTVDVFRNK
ncbi:MAG: SH3 domain-containing protein [Alkalibacterium sp.]|nr:SH3 domain-containing protein [Alkalibacterium sp.]